MKDLDLSSCGTEFLKSLKLKIHEELRKRGERKHKYGRAVGRRMLRIHGMKPADFADEEQEATEIRLFNGHFLASLPHRGRGDPHKWKPYLSPLIAQDWSELYPRETEVGDHYVYAHVDPRKEVFVTTDDAGGNYGGQPFYIGKGIGNRAFDLKRNEGHGKTIKEILVDNFPPSSIVRVLFSELSEQKALEIESKLIYFFGTQFSIRQDGWLVNLTQPSVPEFTASMQRVTAKPS